MAEPEDDKQVLIRVPASWHDFLRDKAHDERTSISALVRTALSDFYKLAPPTPPPPPVNRKGGVVYGRTKHSLASVTAEGDRS